MFGKKKQKNEEENDSLNFSIEDYKMEDRYDSHNLVVGNLEYVSNEKSHCPMIIQTEQKYIFEKINNEGKTRYREIFTGFIADASESKYFNLPYVVNIMPLKTQISTVADIIPRYGLLLALNEVNTNKKTKELKKRL